MSLDFVDNHTKVGSALHELQGLRVSVVAGAAAGTKMNVAALRTEDTLLAAVVSNDAAAAALADDVANVTIQSVKASGTLTISGNPTNAETFVVNATTYTFKTTPTVARDVEITAGDNTQMAADVAAAINKHETRWTGNGFNAPAVVATSAAGVVTITALEEGTGGNSITLTEAATNVAVSGSGTLAGGTATGGIKSATNLANKSVILIWFDKNH